MLAAPVIRPQCRIWLYRAPAVVLGRAQRGWHAGLAPAALPIVDRAAGGGAVLVGPWLLGASVALPLADPRLAGAVADSYRWLGAAFVAALAEHGVVAESVAPAAARRAPEALAWACFAGVTSAEVLAAGRKLVGFAQRRNRHGVLLVAGALLGPVPWAELVAALGRPAEQTVALAAMTIDAAELRGRPLAGEALAASLAGRLGGAAG
ncbi:MAG: ligase [Lautropia sp.]